MYSKVTIVIVRIHFQAVRYIFGLKWGLLVRIAFYYILSWTNDDGMALDNEQRA